MHPFIAACGRVIRAGHGVEALLALVLLLGSGVISAREPAVGRATVQAESNAWLEIDLAAFAGNLRQLKTDLGGNSQICAVLKADAYGHGLALVMPAIIEQRIPCVAVASNEELRIVREGGYTGRLMRVRMATPGEIEAALPYDAEELIGNEELARMAGQAAERRGRHLKIHLALNSGGMSRNGIDMSLPEGCAQVRAIAAQPGLRIVGIMTHFPIEDEVDVRRGLKRFKHDAAVAVVEARLDRSRILLHAANSFAALQVPESRLDMVRPGGVLFGDGPAGHEAYRRVMEFKSRVAAIQVFPAGATVGYDRSRVLRRPSRLANVPVGYSDGYRAALGNKTHVLIHGQRAPVVGRVSMNTLMVDVSDIDDIHPGDEVVLFGRQGGAEITQAELEKATGSLLADLYVIWGAANPSVAR
jgi:alanine racemase